MKASIKEIRSKCGLSVWVCMIEEKEICRSWSEQGLRQIMIHHARKAMRQWPTY